MSLSDEEFGRAIDSAGTVPELSRILQDRPVDGLGTRAVRRIIRALDRIAPEPRARIGFAGSHTLDPLPDALRAVAARAGIPLAVEQAPYGQYFQAVASAQSALAVFAPDLLVLSVSLRDIAPSAVFDFPALSPEAARAERDSIVGHLKQWAQLAVANTSATIVICNFPRSSMPALGIADLKAPVSQTEWLMELNLELLRAFRSSERVCICDLDRVMASYGGERAISERMYYLAKQPWQDGFCFALGEELLRYVVATKAWTRKCLVMDLDNTLWGGVVGEDGAASLLIGPGHPQGEAYEDFQCAVRELKHRGVILAIASKNNPDDVQDAFRQRAEMPLKLEDFSAVSVGWDAKSLGVGKIAEALNIGSDSMAFFDDNPAERLQMSAARPEVLVVDVPRDVAAYTQALRRQPWFERLRVTSEDASKAAQYREQAQREQIRQGAADISEYLRELGSEVTVRAVGSEDVARVHQLFNKTNQFNLTTPRYSIAEVQEFASSSRFVLRLASAKDRFGDLGIIGVYLLEKVGRDARLATFLMSCRALGRAIETAVMNCLKMDAQSMAPGGRLAARFIPTRKNTPAREFLREQGMLVQEQLEDGTADYVATIDELTAIDVPHLSIHFLRAENELER